MAAEAGSRENPFEIHAVNAETGQLLQPGGGKKPGVGLAVHAVAVGSKEQTLVYFVLSRESALKIAGQLIEVADPK